jgi:hypothetical protein
MSEKRQKMVLRPQTAGVLGLPARPPRVPPLNGCPVRIAYCTSVKHPMHREVLTYRSVRYCAAAWEWYRGAWIPAAIPARWQWQPAIDGSTRPDDAGVIPF